MTIRNARTIAAGSTAVAAAAALSIAATAPALAAPEDAATLAADTTTSPAFTPPTTLDVLANDVAPEGASLDASTLSLVDETGQTVDELVTELGTWSVVDGALEFAPAEGVAAEEAATDAVTYLVLTDGGVAATATASVEITPADTGQDEGEGDDGAEETEPEAPEVPEPEVPEEPVAPAELIEGVADEAETERRGEATLDVLANDIEAAGAALDPETLQLVGEDGAPTDELTTDEGTWTVVDGQVEFAAHPSHSGEATAEYVVETADATVTATATVDVEHLPSQAGEQAQSQH